MIQWQWWWLLSMLFFKRPHSWQLTVDTEVIVCWQCDLIDVCFTCVLSFVAFFDSRYVQPQAIVFQSFNKHPIRASQLKCNASTNSHRIIQPCVSLWQWTWRWCQVKVKMQWSYYWTVVGCSLPSHWSFSPEVDINLWRMRCQINGYLSDIREELYPFWLVPIYTARWQRHHVRERLAVNRARQCSAWDSNLRPVACEDVWP